jgi:uncharacterized protein YjbI with pentapeptide repeats
VAHNCGCKEGVNLSDAELSESNLTGADLSGAQVTHEQLAQVRSLDGVTMPNGQKYEDWLKDRVGHGESEG